MPLLELPRSFDMSVALPGHRREIGFLGRPASGELWKNGLLAGERTPFRSSLSDQAI